MKSSLAESVTFRLKECLPETGKPIALHEPSFTGNEWKYVKECLDSSWVSSAGSFVERFEAMLCDFTGVRYAIATINGTSALHVSLKAAGVKPGDEVLCPALTFVATANAITYCGATPHFLDSEEKGLGLDPQRLTDYLKTTAKIETNGCRNRFTDRPIRALIAMHTFGHPVDLDPIADICGRFRLALVEDAAQSLGSYYKGKHTGHWGVAAELSFNGNKTVTTGGGGAVLTNDRTIADYVRHVSTTARLPHQWTFFHDEVGYNYRLPGINAALGCAQLEQLPALLLKKRALAEKYRAAFEGLEGVRFFSEPPYARSNYWLNALLLDKADTKERDRLLEATNNNGIMTRPVWALMHKLPMFSNCPRMDLPVAESLEARLINIPSSPSLI